VGTLAPSAPLVPLPMPSRKHFTKMALPSLYAETRDKLVKRSTAG